MYILEFYCLVCSTVYETIKTLNPKESYSLRQSNQLPTSIQIRCRKPECRSEGRWTTDVDRLCSVRVFVQDDRLTEEINGIA